MPRRRVAPAETGDRVVRIVAIGADRTASAIGREAAVAAQIGSAKGWCGSLLPPGYPIGRESGPCRDRAVYVPWSRFCGPARRLSAPIAALFTLGKIVELKLV
jgi:hypothetical protein